MENKEITTLSYPPLARIKALDSGSLPSFCTFKLTNSAPELITAEEGQILIQSYSHYVANIQLSQFRMKEDVSINLCVKEPAFLMFIMLNGCSILYDKSNRIVSETKGDCATLVHMTPGNYRRTILKGNHKIVTLTFRPDWFLSRTESMEEMAELRENYLTKKLPYTVLPHCSIIDGIPLLLEALRAEKNVDQIGIDTKFYHFAQECILLYHKKLVNARYDANTINRGKANEIMGYIKQNYANKSVEDLPNLAIMFNISEKNLLRLIKAEFGKPLHDIVIFLRMHYGLKMLLTSDRPIHEVAILMGYNDPLYFSRVFKKCHSVPPSDVHRLCL